MGLLPTKTSRRRNARAGSYIRTGRNLRSISQDGAPRFLQFGAKLTYFIVSDNITNEHIVRHVTEPHQSTVRSGRIGSDRIRSDRLDY
jgi:hypothetical protein